MSKNLTERQKEVFEALRCYVSDYGIAPSHVELAELIGVRSSKAAADPVSYTHLTLPTN